MALVASGTRFWVPWPLLGLSDVKVQKNSASLHWRLHCIDPDSKPGDYQGGAQNSYCLRAFKGRRIVPDSTTLRTGILELECAIEQDALLTISANRIPLSLQLAKPLSCCLEHRQSFDKGAAALAGQKLLQEARRMTSPCDSGAEVYAQRWGMLVELEAAASAVEGNDSRVLFDVPITWTETQTAEGKKSRGSFIISARLARSHKLKFRGLLPRGGESASSWLCLRTHDLQWSAHARIVQAGILEDGHQLTLDDEEKATDKTQNSIHVVFDIEGTRTATPDIVEYVPKSLSYSCMHMALSDINPPARVDGLPPAPLLARDIVLGRLPLEFQEERQDLSAWHLNSSQEQAVCRALARHFQLLHGPPGTGKTRTAAVLMTLFAQRNLGARCAILFGAPTNRAVDCALLYTNQLCESYFAERLRARVEQDGDAECAICLDANPDVVTACGHVFHRTCLARCLQQSSQCPLCRQILKQPRGGLRMLRIYGADAERQDFPVPTRVDHPNVQTFKVQVIPENMRRFSWHWRCHAAAGEEPSEEAVACRQAYDRLRACAPKSSEFEERRSEYYAALSKARAAEIRQADVIFSTCVSARRNALLEALLQKTAPEIRQVVMDEAGQAPEPEALCLLTLARYAQHAVLFGDHKQLRPILRSKVAEQAGMGMSLFERLATRCRNDDSDICSPVSLLAEQYRMHPSISRFPRRHFYGGRVKDHPSVKDRIRCVLHHRGSEAPFLVWTGHSGGEELQRLRTIGSGGVGSRANNEEATRAVSLAARLARHVGESAVAVLSYYNSQVAKISEMLRRESLRGIHVGSIATAQGSEWDYVILSTVRSEKGGRLGLLSDPHTMNVAITRARHGLVVLCEQSALEGCPNWSALLQHARSEGLITKEDPEVRAAAPLRRPLTDEEALDQEQEKLAAMLQKILSTPRQESSSKSRSSSRSRSPLRGSPSGRSSSKPSMHTVVFQGLERACGA
ncbi:Helz2 [Symbiodinium sp. CCMP2592]|nr:Helz2 [Symbiodinium sp. CCMP2592]